MLYMVETGGEEGFDKSKAERKEVVEDEIDQILSKKDGMIPRQRDPQLYVTFPPQLGFACKLPHVQTLILLTGAAMAPRGSA